MKSGETNTKPRIFTHGHKPSTLNATRKTYFLLKVFSFFFYAFILCFKILTQVLLTGLT